MNSEINVITWFAYLYFAILSFTLTSCTINWNQKMIRAFLFGGCFVLELERSQKPTLIKSQNLFFHKIKTLNRLKINFAASKENINRLIKKKIYHKIRKRLRTHIKWAFCQKIDWNNFINMMKIERHFLLKVSIKKILSWFNQIKTNLLQILKWIWWVILRIGILKIYVGTSLRYQC